MSSRAFEQVIARLEADIVARELVPGQRLPAERELATQLGVSRPSVREALRVLEAMGVIEIRPGPEHGARLRETPGNGFGEVVRLHLELKHATVADVVEFRVLVESWAVEHLAARPPEDTAALAALAEEMAAADLPPEEFTAADAGFHVALVRAAGNPVLALVAEGARSALERLLLERALTESDWPATRARLNGEHLRVVALIGERSGPEAAAVLEGHIRGFLTGP